MSFSEELAAARQALAEGNLSDAVEHLYCAIVERPTDEQLPDPENLALACSFDGAELLLKLQLELLTRIHGAHPQSSRVELFRARFTRILGDAEGALRIAEEQHARYPDYFSTIALGTNCKLTGDDGGVLSAFEEALEHQPDDMATRLELGDLHLDLARWKLARDRYREALYLDDDEPWARPSWMFAELRLSDDAEWEKRLRDYTEQHPDNPRAQHLLGLCKAFRWRFRVQVF